MAVERPDASIRATAALPLAWPTGASFGRDHLYVNDVYNRRIVRMDQVYALETKLAVR